ncbi:glycoside hydrolase family 2 protein, partial [Bacteroides ovatus]
MHKKIQYILLLMLFTCLIPVTAKNKSRISLNDEWQFKQSISQNWLPAQVPGAVHTDLMNNRMIKDPFYGVNEKSLQWIGEKDWEYKKTFIVDEALLQAPNVQLVFAGLDTYADIYINDYLVMKCDNMFRTWTLNPLPYLKKGENTIRIYFHSIFKVDMPKYLASPFQLQAWPNNDQSDIMLSLYARKAGYNYGWDGGPRLITTGIWRDVYLEYWDDIHIDGTQIITRKLESGKAKMEAVCTVMSDEDTKATFTVEYDKKEAVRKQVALTKGMNTVRVDFEVKNPELWWTNGLGNPRMYDFDIVLDKEGRKVTDRVKTGIRTLEIVREKDEQGQSMFVKLNGKAVFMKGANYIPLDNFPNRVPESWYEYIIKSAADVNMNMLRIWGGG